MICFMWRCAGLWRYIAFVISRIISFLHTVWKWLWFTTHAFPLKQLVILVVNQHTVSSKTGIPVAANMHRSFKFKQMGLYCIIQAYILFMPIFITLIDCFFVPLIDCFFCTSKNFVFIDHQWSSSQIHRIEFEDSTPPKSKLK